MDLGIPFAAALRLFWATHAPRRIIRLLFLRRSRIRFLAFSLTKNLFACQPKAVFPCRRPIGHSLWLFKKEPFSISGCESQGEAGSWRLLLKLVILLAKNLTDSLAKTCASEKSCLNKRPDSTSKIVLRRTVAPHEQVQLENRGQFNFAMI